MSGRMSNRCCKLLTSRLSRRAPVRSATGACVEGRGPCPTRVRAVPAAAAAAAPPHRAVAGPRRIVLSDGAYYVQGLLTTQLNNVSARAHARVCSHMRGIRSRVRVAGRVCDDVPSAPGQRRDPSQLHHPC